MVEDYERNYGNGWISVYRSIKSHWIWSDPVKLKWWLTILFEVNHSTSKVALGYNVVEVKRGQSAKSLRTWANDLETGVKSVTKFFEMLEKDGMIKRETLGKGKQSTTLLTVCNYGTYQNKETQRGTLKGTKGTTQMGTQEERNGVHEGGTNNNDNNADNGNNEEQGLITTFDIFWKMYDYNVGLRQAQHEWTEITSEMPHKIAKILEHVPKYVKSTPDKQFRKRPENYLRDRAWKDEVVEETKPEPKKYRIPL